MGIRIPATDFHPPANVLRARMSPCTTSLGSVSRPLAAFRLVAGAAEPRRRAPRHPRRRCHDPGTSSTASSSSARTRRTTSFYVPTRWRAIPPPPRLHSKYLRPEAFGRTTVLHTRDPRVADTDDFIAPSAPPPRSGFPAGASGGRWTPTSAPGPPRHSSKFYRRGGVIGGSSAGATVQGLLPLARARGQPRHDGPRTRDRIRIPARLRHRPARHRPRAAR